MLLFKTTLAQAVALALIEGVSIKEFNEFAAGEFALVNSDRVPYLAIQIDDLGRHRHPNGTLCLTPLPIRLGMKLTPLQVANIRSNCGVDALGNWINPKTGQFYGGFGLGFDDERGGVNPISWKSATLQEFELQPDGTSRQVDRGPFNALPENDLRREVTKRVRVSTLEEFEKLEV